MKHALRRPLAVAVAAATAAAGTALLAPTASASTAQKNPTAEQAAASVFRKAVTVDGVVEHLRALQAIADANDDTRAAGSPGYENSTDYIVARLEAAGYDAQLDEFQFVYNADASPPVLSTGGVNLSESAISMSFSPNGDVTAPLAPVGAPGDATPGCEAADFAGFTAGSSPSSAAAPARSPSRRRTPPRPVRPAPSSTTTPPGR